MILTPAILKQIIDTIEEDTAEPVILPDHAYGPDGRVMVYVDRVPIDLHRHLHNLMIRPLGYHERMHQRHDIDKRNINPWLFIVRADRKSARTHCNQGHEYTPENEAPPNRRGYRCLTCLRNSIRNPGAVANKDKTHCPQNHKYTPENTLIKVDGKRRCLICVREQNRDYMRRKRAEQKEQK